MCSAIEAIANPKIPVNENIVKHCPLRAGYRSGGKEGVNWLFLQARKDPMRIDRGIFYEVLPGAGCFLAFGLDLFRFTDGLNDRSGEILAGDEHVY